VKYLYSKSDIDISQGSVVKRLKCGGIFSYQLIAKKLLNYANPVGVSEQTGYIKSHRVLP